ncbi:helix-turn-helix transcriptional regulator [Chitinophaga sp. MM2321]|uniref:helix-turn-helix domain-containing protein n=1 Tax=Chitinophaga sp. MM2321 TaxID=3137178 RepID=UPI0032D5B0A8
MADIKSIQDFYAETAASVPENVPKEIGHFNVFETAHFAGEKAAPMPYDRRAYYKISLIIGKNRAEYADKVIDIEAHALLFATPKIPYNWQPLSDVQGGYFCIFTEDFLTKNSSDLLLQQLPVFSPGGHPVLSLTAEQVKEVEHIFLKMFKEMNSDYVYKYDLLRNYVIELIHNGQKLQPVTTLYTDSNAAGRISALFTELLERQFPVESPRQQLKLRAAKDYASQLSVHVNYLNKVLKDVTGKTTTVLIAERLVKEAKVMLKHTDRNISEIAWSLGFEDPSHFNYLFKKHTLLTPTAFRS